jgi:hypothetical protein
MPDRPHPIDARSGIGAGVTIAEIGGAWVGSLARGVGADGLRPDPRGVPRAAICLVGVAVNL